MIKVNDLVTIVVPVYNTGKYLTKCIESILKQTYKNIEVLIINDGSTDDSEDVIKQFNDIRIIYTKRKNHGVSATRNYGIKKAIGKYITFIDSDDWIEENYIYELVNGIDIHDCIIMNSTDFNNRKSWKFISLNKEYILENRDAIKASISCDLMYSTCWGKLYKTDYVKKIKFDENMSIAEDLKFLIEYFSISNTIKIIPLNLYHYNIRNGSAVRSGYNKKWNDEIKYLNELLEKYNSNDINELLINRLVNLYLNLLKFKLSKKDKRIIKRELKKNKWLFLQSSNNSFRKKIKFVINLILP